MPILGILASQVTGHLAPPPSYDSIATVTVGSGGSSTISFTSISSAYTHLQLRMILNDATGNSAALTFNSDTGANYSRHRVTGNGSTTGSIGTPGLSFVSILGQAGVGSATSTFATVVIDLLDYTNTNKYKTIRTLSGIDQNGSGGVEFMSGLWQSTAAVSAITVTNGGAANFVQYSQIALYGIKG